MKPKVGIIGDGNVGTALRKGLDSAGYPVKATGHDPEEVANVAGWAEVVILAVPFDQRKNAVEEMGDDAIEGKVVVDVTNAVTPPSYELEIEPDETSGAEELQKWAPNARVVKGFNTVFADHMSSGRVKNERLTLFVAGDDERAKAVVRDMGREIGFDPVDAGPLRNARWMETLGYFNMQLAQQEGLGRGIGFRLVH